MADGRERLPHRHVYDIPALRFTGGAASMPLEGVQSRGKVKERGGTT
jgi:hypothetical protein